MCFKTVENFKLQKAKIENKQFLITLFKHHKTRVIHTRVPFHGLFLGGFSFPAHSEVVPVASAAPHVRVIYARPPYVVPKKTTKRSFSNVTSPLIWHLLNTGL